MKQSKDPFEIAIEIALIAFIYGAMLLALAYTFLFYSATHQHNDAPTRTHGAICRQPSLPRLKQQKKQYDNPKRKH